MTVQEFITGFIGASPIEIVASVAGFLCVFLIIKRSIWCWFFGFIQVTLFAYIFFGAKLYSDAGLHVIYMGLQFYGWWNWIQHRDPQRKQTPALIIHPTSVKDLALWAGVAIMGTLVLGYLMQTYTDASFAYPDAFTTSASLVAQWLLTRRHLFNWLFWIVVDIVAIFIYLQKGLYPTSALYFAFLIMCFFGQYSWWKQYRLQQETTQQIADQGAHG
jgi:nicotinamide mononucleotide transporter